MINVLDSIQYIMDIKKAHKEIGFIGLGIMGKPMADNLVKAGFNVSFYARRKLIIEDMIAKGSKFLPSVSDVSKSCKIIFLNLPESKDVKNVVLGRNGLYEGLQKNTIIIDMSTICPNVTQELSNILLKKNCYLIDAPVSGGEIGAIKGTLSIMVGGDRQKFLKIKSLLNTLGKDITYIGKSGSGQIAKACNQILVAGTMSAVSEILILADKLKCDKTLIKKALMGGFAKSKILEVHGERMIKNNYKPGFTSKLHLKDMIIARNLARKVGLKLMGANRSLQLLKQVKKSKLSNKDSSIIHKMIMKKSK